MIASIHKYIFMCTPICQSRKVEYNRIQFSFELKVYTLYMYQSRKLEYKRIQFSFSKANSSHRVIVSSFQKHFLHVFIFNLEFA